MNRRAFLHTVAASTFLGVPMNLAGLSSLATSLPSAERMPALFLGHGSPMNAIDDNEFVRGFRHINETLPKPTAILCVSAHWETRGTFVTAMEKPETIHDFGGFPEELHQVQYPAPGSPVLAKQTQELVKGTKVQPDMKWGLDHGAWSVIKHLYPHADVPVIQLSLDVGMNPEQHYALARELRALRNKGVLIIGSGNMVHNLGRVAWDKLSLPEYGYDWALEAREHMTRSIRENNHKHLIDFRKRGKAFDLAIPTPEHYLPLLYTLGLQEKNDEVSLFNDKAIGGSLTMTSVKLG
ncbi:MAG: 4,5-DOPA dioxygenase extradiol [Candidatus Kapaibacterium sp.]